MSTHRAGFSFVGTLSLAAALALIAALMFPVLVTAGGQKPLVSCQANLKEIGAAIRMYMEDYDGMAPLARSVEIDAAPVVRESVAGESPFVLTGGPALLSPLLGDCPPLGRPGLWPLHLVLDCYVSRPSVWRDPEDRGDLCCQPETSAPPSSPAARTAYARHGSSYQYNQRLVWEPATGTAPAAATVRPGGRLAPVAGNEITRPAEVPLVFDGQGAWHQPAGPGHDAPDAYLASAGGRGYNVVFADGHVRFVTPTDLLNRSPERPVGLLYRDPRQ